MKNKIQALRSPTSHITRGNVFEDLGFSKADSQVLAIKTDLHSLIVKTIKDKGYSRRDLEGVFNEPQPRISELMTGKISKLSAEKLIQYVSLLGINLRILPSLRGRMGSAPTRRVASK